MKTSSPSTQGKVVSGLFAGIGGLELGFKRAGYHSSILCEIDPVAQHVLRAKFPGAQIVGDVKELKTIGACDVLCAGFPCQDLSSSGNKVGINGERSSLIDEVFRVLEASDARWVVVENVRFMLHLNGGEAMRRVIDGFERLGYNWAYRLINSQAFGVPQRRHRVYFVASKYEDPREVLLSDEGSTEVVEGDDISIDDHIGFYWTEGAYASGLSRNAIPPLKSGSTIGIPSPPAIYFPNGMVGMPAIQDAERLQGFDADWTKEAEEVAKPSARWRLLGNSVTVPVSEWLAGRLNDPKPYDSSADKPIGNKWPHAAWSINGKRYQSNASDRPVDRPTVSIGNFLLHPAKPLSRRAIDGFLSRANKGNLKFPKGFIEALSQFSINKAK